jgi:1-acyl-sn-glycerol-3-phosphate acyltransferase
MTSAGILIAASRFLVGGAAHWVGCRPTPRQRIYFANHASHMDTLVLWAALPPALRRTTRPVAAADYWGHDRLRRHIALGVLNSVLVDRGGGLAALDPVHDALCEGASLIFFPEGTRGTGPLPGPFRSGLFHIAARHESVELVPVYLANLGRALPRGVRLPVPVSATVLFGAPVERRSGEAKEAFLARAREAVTELGRSHYPETADAG